MDESTVQKVRFLRGNVIFSGKKEICLRSIIVFSLYQYSSSSICIGVRELVEFEILAERIVINSRNETELRILFSRRMEYHVTNTFTQVKNAPAFDTLLLMLLSLLPSLLLLLLL